MNGLVVSFQLIAHLIQCGIVRDTVKKEFGPSFVNSGRDWVDGGG
jgi:hypothetical protein